MRRLRGPTPLVALLAMAGMALGQTAEPSTEPAKGGEAASAPEPATASEPSSGEAPAESGEPADPMDEMTNDAVVEATGEDGGPVIVGVPRETWSGFKLIRWGGGLEYRYQHHEDTIDTTGQPRQTDTETRNRYLLNLDGEAIAGHKNLFDLTGSMQLGLEQIENESTGATTFSESEDDFVTLFDLNALILGTSKAPTEIYAQRSQESFDQAFAGTIDQTTTEYGISTRLQTENTGTTFRLYQRDQTTSGGFANLDSSSKQQSFSAISNIRLSPVSKLDASYVFDRISEDQGSFRDDYDRHDVSLVHTYNFGGDPTRHELRSDLRLYNQGGNQDLTRIRWDELLTLRHTDRFTTRYETLLEQFESRGQTQVHARGEAQAMHRLFESLATTVSVGGDELSVEDFTSDEMFASLHFDYTKKVPLGRLDAVAGGAFNSQSNSDRGSTIHIVNESHTMTDGFATIIARRNVIGSSVLVTAIGGFPTYIEGIDYSLTVFTDRIELRTLFGGAITSGQQVWVTYDIGPEPGYDVDTTNLNASLRYAITEGALDGLAVYSRYNKVSQDLRSGDPSQITLNDLDDLLMGIEFERAGFTGRYEYNDHDSTFDPFTVNRLQFLYVRRMGVSSRLSAELSREDVDFRLQNEQVVYDRASVRATLRLTQNTELTALVQYRNEDSSKDGTTQGLDEKLGLTWRYGRTTVSGTVKNSNIDSEQSSQTSQFVEFEVTRRF